MYHVNPVKWGLSVRACITATTTRDVYVDGMVVQRVIVPSIKYKIGV